MAIYALVTYLLTYLYIIISTDCYIFSDAQYELLELWRFTGLSFTDIADLYMKSFDETLSDMYSDQQENLVVPGSKSPGYLVSTQVELCDQRRVNGWLLLSVSLFWRALVAQWCKQLLESQSVWG